MRFVIYVIYNLFYFGITLFFLFFANSFLNGFFIPHDWVWKNGVPRTDNETLLFIVQIIILIIESVLLMTFMFFINKWYLTSIYKTSNAQSIAIWTGVISLVVSFIIIIYTTSSFQK